MENTWKPKQRSEGPMICRWCGSEFTAEYKSLYCTPRCRYAYKNEAVYRKAKLEGLSIREYHLYKQLLKSNTSS